MLHELYPNGLPTLDTKGGQDQVFEQASCPPLENQRIHSVKEEFAKGDVWLTTREGGQLLNEPQRTVKHRCKVGIYTSKMVIGNGGEQYRILLSSLPESAQVRYWQELTMTKWQSLRPEARKLSRKAEEVALKRADLVRIYLEDCDRPAVTGGSVVERKKMFVARFNLGEWPDLLEVIGETSYKTLERWRKALSDGHSDPFVLAPRYGTTRKVTGESIRTVTADHGKILLGYALGPNRLKQSEAIRAARNDYAAAGMDCSISDKTLRRWLDDWRMANADLWTLLRHGEKSLNDTISPYIIRDREAVEVGDIVTADGHVLNFWIINPATGKPKRMMLVLVYDFRSNYPLGWEIMPTENTEAIASAYRRTILRLGFSPRVFYLDNGRAFRAQFFSGTKDFRQAGVDGLFERLGSKVVHAQPYHGQSKTVERFFGAFEELERSIASYTGTSIDNKPGHMHRGEKFLGRLQRDLYGGSAISLADAHTFIAAWFDEYVTRPSSGALNGQTPQEVLEESLERVRQQPDFESRQVSPSDLAYLMMTSKVTTLYANGIRFDGTYYYSEELYTLDKGQTNRLVMRYDMQDRDMILVYTDDGQFVCEARRADKIHPAAQHLGTASNVLALQSALARKKTLKASTMQTASAFARGLHTQTTPPMEKVQKQKNKPLLLTTAPPFDELAIPTIALFESDLDDDQPTFERT